MQRRAQARPAPDPEASRGAVPSPFQAHLEALHARHLALDAGDVARYIPELAKADPSWFGIAVATIDGHVYEVGDSRQPFTIQSISKLRSMCPIARLRWPVARSDSKTAASTASRRPA